jgi:hypothetical protein
MAKWLHGYMAEWLSKDIGHWILDIGYWILSFSVLPCPWQGFLKLLNVENLALRFFRNLEFRTFRLRLKPKAFPPVGGEEPERRN